MLMEEADDFIVEDDGASAAPEDLCQREGLPGKADSTTLGWSRPSSAVPDAVRHILDFRRNSEESGYGSACEAGLSSKFQGFSAEVKQLAAAEGASQPHERRRGLEVHTFFDLQAYNLQGVVERPKKRPGPVQLIYMFYSRVYDKLIGKQRGVDVSLYAAIDLQSRLLGFREILDFAQDFKLTPAKIGRRELERIFATVHAGVPDSPQLKFESKITYAEFVDFLLLCADTGEPMDRSKIDGSRVAVEDCPRLERARKLAAFLELRNIKAVQLNLHNAYRDVHFWKLSDGADFEKEARAADVRSRPQHRVDLIHPARRVNAVRDAAARKYLERFTWVPQDRLWEEYELPILDMGTGIVGGTERHFRVLLQNCEFSLAKVKLRAEDSGPLRMPWRDTLLGPGQTIEVVVEFIPLECGEWHGRLVASVSWQTTSSECYEDEYTVPTYSRVAHPHSLIAKCDGELPQHAPRPSHKDRSRRNIIDPSSLTAHQLRTPTPGRSRPTSACSSGPSGALRALKRPASSSRAGSKQPPSSSSASRPGSGLPKLPASNSPRPRVRAASAGANSKYLRPSSQPSRISRPHSAPMAVNLRPSEEENKENSVAHYGVESACGLASRAEALTSDLRRSCGYLHASSSQPPVAGIRKCIPTPGR